MQAPVGRTATGSSSNTGGSETGGTSIGSDDLEALVESVDEAYRASPKCCWLMRQASRQAIFSVKDKQGRPIYRTTAFPASIVVQMLASGAISKRGGVLQEVDVPADLFLSEIEKRSIRIDYSVE